jgi:hypothetical protein
MRDVRRYDLQDHGEAGFLGCFDGLLRITSEDGKGDGDSRFVQDLLRLDLCEQSAALAAGVIDYFSDGHAPEAALT